MTSEGQYLAAVDASPVPFRALLVTDDAELQRVLTRILAETGTAPCEVQHASTLADATLAAAGCDVILLE